MKLLIETQKNKTIIEGSDPVFEQNEGNKIQFWGDPIFPSDFKKNISTIKTQKLINSVKGHYYYLIQKANGQLIMGSSLFSVLPIYYFEKEKRIMVASKLNLISDQLEEKTLNKRFILENVLFNYPLFNQTKYEEIKLVPANHALLIEDNKIDFIQHDSIDQLFVSQPLPWKKSLNHITKTFIDVAQKYLPDEKFALSLTGGFDGRTLTAIGLHFNKDFFVYTFGNESSGDVIVAKNISNKRNLKHKVFNLNNQYVKNSSLKSGIEFIKGSNYTASFSRAHYNYSSKEISQEVKYIVTGNFGSEIFRAAHVAGPLIGNNLYNLFKSNSLSEGIEQLQNAPEWNWLNKEEFQKAWTDLKQDLSILPCFNNDFKHLTKNQQFYKFFFEEIIRKYFGAEMVNQFNYLHNRTPFLDIDFLSEIFKTNLAGAYSDFFTHNPVKRFKGQVTYAKIINKTCPELGRIQTDKGYAPSDLLSISGKFKIVKNFLHKRFRKKMGQNTPDPYGVNAAFKHNKTYYLSEINKSDSGLFDLNLMLDYLKTNDKDKNNFFISLSQLISVNKII